jgi:hypothetical protein
MADWLLTGGTTDAHLLTLAVESSAKRDVGGAEEPPFVNDHNQVVERRMLKLGPAQWP